MIKVATPTIPIHDLRLRAMASESVPKARRVTLQEVAREPFRIFFPMALLAGIIGVSLWPLYFTHLVSFYPGVSHARIMACGFFGAFIFGFLGTAMPRMLSSKPFRVYEVIPLVLIHLGMVTAFLCGKILYGDILTSVLVLVFAVIIAMRANSRKDLPPPGFVLVGLSLAALAAGAALAVVLAIAERTGDIDARWVVFQRLLSYQAFVLLPILGIGPFLLPRFLGMPTPEFSESPIPDSGWLRKAGLALAVGAIIIGSMVLEALGSDRIAYALRFGVTLLYFLLEMPLHRAPGSSSPLGLSIRISFVAIVAGFLAVALFPAYRVALLHLTLIGGFAVLTLTVATRVVYGHSGNLALLKGRNRWLLVSVGVMLFAMVTRISGDFWPKIMASHYIYGAILWIVAALVWAAFVLPKVLIADSE